MPETLTYVCPFCDREVRVGEPCPGCAKKAGKTENRNAPVKSGGPPEAHDPVYDGLDLPDEDFDYEEFVEREFGGKAHRRLGVKWYWWVLGVIVLAAWVLAAIKFARW